jgi:hypothetical protein
MRLRCRQVSGQSQTVELIQPEKLEDDGYVTRIIREYVRSNPSATPDELSRWLAGRGIHITAMFAGAILAAIREG